MLVSGEFIHDLRGKIGFILKKKARIADKTADKRI